MLTPAQLRAPPAPRPRPPPQHAARRFCEGREGRVAFAVGDTRGGVAGQAFDQEYRSASIVKAMILVGYLDRIERNGQRLTSADDERLADMTRLSDNDAAT